MVQGSSRPTAGLYVTLVALATVTACLMALPLVRSLFKIEIDYNEGWNAYHSRDAAQGKRVYAETGEWTSVNYPPVSFYVNGYLGRLMGDVVLAGRLVSLASLLAVSLGTGYVVYARSRRVVEAVFAGLLCLGSFAAFATNYVAMNDPQLLGHAFTFAALVLYLGEENALNRNWRLAAIALLCALGLFTKHSIVALPLAIGVDILIRSPKRFAVWLGYCLAAAGAFGCLSLLLGGTEFLRQLSFPRGFSLRKAAVDTARFGLKVAVPLVVLLPWLLQRLRSNPVRVLAVYLGFGLVFGAYTSGGDGTDVNMFFDAIIALGLLSGVFLSDRANGAVPRAYLGRVAAGLLPVALMLGVVSMFVVKLQRSGSPDELRYGIWRPGLSSALRQAEQASLEDARKMQKYGGPAICENLLISFYSGKELVFDPFYAAEAIAVGRAGEGHLLAHIESRSFSLIQLESELDPPGTEMGAYGPVEKASSGDRFTRNSRMAIAEHYRIAWRSMNGVFYVPKAPPDGSGQ